VNGTRLVGAIGRTQSFGKSMRWLLRT